MRRILLSASLPFSSPDHEAPDPYSGQDIGLAAAAVMEAVLRDDDMLVVGGHPSISPLALNIAALLGRGPLVSIYQSSYFESSVTPEVRRLMLDYRAQLHWIRGGRNRRTSLQDMRTAMLSEPIDLAFFVGGMQGIEDEFVALGSAQPGCLRHLFSRPGGRARVIAEEWVPDPRPSAETASMNVVNANTIVLNGRGYAALTFGALRRT